SATQDRQHSEHRSGSGDRRTVVGHGGTVWRRDRGATPSGAVSGSSISAHSNPGDGAPGSRYLDRRPLLPSAVVDRPRHDHGGPFRRALVGVAEPEPSARLAPIAHVSSLSPT